MIIELRTLEEGELGSKPIEISFEHFKIS